MKKKLVIKSFFALLVFSVSACGGGGSSDAPSNIPQTSGHFKGDLFLVGDTCQQEEIVSTLPYEMEIGSTGLSAGNPSHIIDVIGDGAGAVNAYFDGLNLINAYLYNINLSNFFADYHCSESITLNLASVDSSEVAPSLIRVERSSNISCVSRNNPDQFKSCNVYYLGEMSVSQ